MPKPLELTVDEVDKGLELFISAAEQRKAQRDMATALNAMGQTAKEVAKSFARFSASVEAWQESGESISQQ